MLIVFITYEIHENHIHVHFISDQQAGAYPALKSKDVQAKIKGVSL